MGKWLTRLKIRERLFVAMAVLLFLLAIVAALGWSGMGSVAAKAQGVLENEARLAQLSDRARAHVVGMRRYEKDAFINLADDRAVEEWVARWQSEREQLDNRLGEFA